MSWFPASTPPPHIDQMGHYFKMLDVIDAWTVRTPISCVAVGIIAVAEMVKAHPLGDWFYLLLPDPYMRVVEDLVNLHASVVLLADVARPWPALVIGTTVTCLLQKLMSSHPLERRKLTGAPEWDVAGVAQTAGELVARNVAALLAGLGHIRSMTGGPDHD